MPELRWLRTLTSVVFAALVAVFAQGCLETEIIDDLATEVRLGNPGVAGEGYEVRKRFRFSRSPLDAAAIELDGGLLSILAPTGADLSFLHRVTVWVETPDGERILLATGEDFPAGARYSPMRIDFADDLRPFVTADARVTLVFRVEPSAWYRPFPPDGITVLAKATVAISL
jgi:hypothetical protein